jgi:NAD(P)-dependent dehydrogenase (short-subunit alcohol dehydrogenase family)
MRARSSVGLIGRLLDRSILFSFDRSGFERHRKGFDENDLSIELKGRTYLVTGANSGLGLETTRGLAVRGARVFMLCRSLERGEVARQGLLSQEGQLDLHALQVDMADFSSIDRLFRNDLPDRVDGLIHNAGVLPEKRQLSPQGFELTTATHLLGPLRLTHRLLPALRSAQGRVILVSSGGMYSQRLDVNRLFEPPDPYDGVTAYAMSKRAQVILGMLWQKSWESSGQLALSMHPGWADTPAVRSSLPRFHALTRAILRSPAQGADTILWLAAAVRGADAPGAFHFDRAPVSPYLLDRTREDVLERHRLWERLHEAAGLEVPPFPEAGQLNALPPR